ncbi:MAG: cell division protein FtsQ/DivIB [Chloroflexia bacterium]
MEQEQRAQFGKARRGRERPHARPRLGRALLQWAADARLAGALLSLGCAFLLGYFYFSPTFRVSTVEVRGNRALPSEEAVRRSQVLTANLFLIDPADVAARLKQIPYVQNVRVERDLPNRVILTLVEHMPSVSWCNGKDPEHRFLVDDEGRILGAEPPEAERMIYIVNMDSDAPPLQPGGQVDGETVRTAQQVFSRLYYDLHIPLMPFEYRKECGLVAVAQAGWRACFGDGSDLERKVRFLAAFLRHPPSEFTEMDLRFPDQIRFR